MASGKIRVEMSTVQVVSVHHVRRQIELAVEERCENKQIVKSSLLMTIVPLYNLDTVYIDQEMSSTDSLHS